MKSVSQFTDGSNRVLGSEDSRETYLGAETGHLSSADKTRLTENTDLIRGEAGFGRDCSETTGPEDQKTHPHTRQTHTNTHTGTQL